MVQGEQTHEAASNMGALRALLILIAIVPLVAIFMAIGGAFGVQSFLFAGFLFILYWAGIKAFAPAEFLPSLLGALVGVGLAYLLHALPAAIGTAGLVITGSLTALSVYLLILGKATMIANNATMLMLTVGGSIAFKSDADFAAAAVSILLAGAYAGALQLLITRIVQMRSNKPSDGTLARETAG